MESFVPLNGSAGNAAPVGGRRRKLKLVTRKVARKALKKLGLKMRGGEAAAPDAPVALPEDTLKKGGAEAAAAAAPAVPAPDAGGRRKTRRGGKKSHRRRGLFGY